MNSSENKDLISILMPAYNAGEYINKAITSILNQTYPNWELLIADDKSTDNTIDIINSFSDKRIKCFHNDKNEGYLKASNKLFEKAQGEFISFQDADDWSDAKRFETFISQFKNDPELACIGSFVKKVNTDNETTKTVEFKCEYKEISSALPANFNCVGSALMLKRDVLKKTGVYNPYFDRVGSEDLYWYGLIVKNFKTINIPEYLYYYRSTPGSVSMEKNMPPKKRASKELASKALEYYMETGKEIFKESARLKNLEDYLFGKYLCWEGKYKEGVSLLLKSVLVNPFKNKERYSLLKIYLPQIFKKQTASAV